MFDQTKKKLLVRHNKVAKQLYNNLFNKLFNYYIFKKIQKQPLEVFCKKRCSWKFRKLHRKAAVLDLFFMKLEVFFNLLKNPTQVLSCEICESFKNVWFEERQQTTPSGGVL